MIDDLEEENIMLKEVRDDLMEENERLRMGEILELRKEVRRLREEIKSREENQKLENKKMMGGNERLRQMAGDYKILLEREVKQ